MSDGVMYMWSYSHIVCFSCCLLLLYWYWLWQMRGEKKYSSCVKSAM